jgi:ribonucleoside-triphosphate reductase (thioredoxin)
VVQQRCKSDPLSEILEELKNEAIATNKTWAKKLGIKQSAAITCVKPSGTVSQLVDSASGIHGRFADYYIRRVRADSRDPLCGVLEAAGVPVETRYTYQPLPRYSPSLRKLLRAL